MACRSACISPAATVRRRPSWRLPPSWRRRSRGSIACRHCKQYMDPRRQALPKAHWAVLRRQSILRLADRRGWRADRRRGRAASPCRGAHASVGRRKLSGHIGAPTRRLRRLNQAPGRQARPQAPVGRRCRMGQDRRSFFCGIRRRAAATRQRVFFSEDAAELHRPGAHANRGLLRGRGPPRSYPGRMIMPGAPGDAPSVHGGLHLIHFSAAASPLHPQKSKGLSRHRLSPCFNWWSQPGSNR